MAPETVKEDWGFDESDECLDECFVLSWESLANGWNRPEEDAAWAYLQPENGDGENAAETAP
jgi:hypothetical protein